MRKEDAKMTYRCIIVGDGAWGLALAKLIGAQDGRVAVVSRLPESAARQRAQQRLFGITQSVHFYQRESMPCVPDAVYIIATASVGVMQAFIDVKDRLKEPWILCAAKGLSCVEDKVLLPHQVYAHVFGHESRFGVLSGPSFAKEVAENIPTVVSLAAKEQDVCSKFVACMQTPRFTPIASADVIGVELCGVYKNITAFMAGLLAGKKMGENMQAAFLQYAITNFAWVLDSVGAQSGTAYSHAGLGDILLSARSEKSRNFTAGLYWAIEQESTKKTELAEGLLNVQLLKRWLSVKNVVSPVVEAAYSLVCGERSSDDVVEALVGTLQGGAK